MAKLINNKLEQFKQAKQRNADGFQRLYERELEAQEEVKRLRAQYEQLLTSSVLEGKDANAELDALNAEIKKADETLTRRKAERHIFSMKAPVEVTPEEVIEYFNGEFMPQFKEQRMQPALDKLLNLKTQWVEAFFEYIDVVKEMEQYNRETASELGDTHRYRLGDVGIKTKDDREKYFITINTLELVQRRNKNSVEIQRILSAKGGN